ncbi:hypothetical protein SAMN06297358_0778 [Pedobacter xixiisoli]|uniref:Uncharacterized protein n=1 Tax=Pedobacter xixiisoli TaxID=1476464 RepID=A0A285ZSM6_9SPHI|nr:hypothetical protein SAMN06297358_0778 [Pedobacter xixiisoli]
MNLVKLFVILEAIIPYSFKKQKIDQLLQRKFIVQKQKPELKKPYLTRPKTIFISSK